MKKIIIYNAFDYSAVFFLAAAKKAGYLPLSACSPSKLWANGAEEIILCNINPTKITSSVQYHPDVELYLIDKIRIISGLLFSPFTEWDKRKSSLNELMAHYTPSMRQNDQDIRSKNWNHNEEAQRYAKALKAAMVKGSNSSWDEYESVLQAAINEIADGCPSPLVGNFYFHYARVMQTTENAIARLEVNTLLKIPKRQIAFAYLDNISDYLDFSHLRRYCLKTYPYLSIIQYRQYGQEYTWFMSNKKLEVCQFFRLPPGNKYEALISAPHKTVLHHLQEVIAELK